MKRGFTLIETLIATTLFLLALGACFELAQVGMRSFTKGTGHTDSVRGASQVIRWLSLELSHARQIYTPDLPTGTLFSLDSHVLTCRAEGLGQGPDLVLGYKLDPESHKVSRLIYDPGFNPLVPSSIVEIENRLRTVEIAVQQIHFKILDPTLFNGQHIMECEVEANDSNNQAPVKVGSRFRVRY